MDMTERGRFCGGRHHVGLRAGVFSLRSLTAASAASVVHQLAAFISRQAFMYEAQASIDW
jgi:hypothetical protein